MEEEKIRDYRSLINQSVKRYADKIAYKYKRDSESKEVEYITKTYKQVKEDVEAISTALLELGLNEKKIVVIGNNRYEWCVSYFAVTTGNMIVVPLDKALPDNEIESLIIRSGAEAVIFDKKYEKALKKTKQNNNSCIKYLICMDPIEEPEILKYNDLLMKGKELIEKGEHRYQEIQIDENKMSIMLFTSGTTSLPKAVMLSQKNICSNLEAISYWVKLYSEDVLLSFLPIHHTFECTITFYMDFIAGHVLLFVMD